MPKLQKYFEQFHQRIRLGSYKENQTLREKRDLLLADLKSGLTEQFDKPEDAPRYKVVNLGSYALNVGVKPLDGNYDIDVGIVFEISTKDHPDPRNVKKWVRDALLRHNRKVVWRSPCITVFYAAGYHVDLSVMAGGPAGDWHPRFLARGKEHSSETKRGWEKAEPEKLVELIKGAHVGDDAAQFRRVIRALKRWKQHRFSLRGNDAPPSVGIVLSAYHWFSPVKSCTDPVQWIYDYDDCGAILQLVYKMISGVAGSSDSRLSVALPVEPFDDVFRRMTAKQMEGFLEELGILKNALEMAISAQETKDSLQALRELFGDDFPAEPDENKKFSSPGFVGSIQGA